MDAGLKKTPGKPKMLGKKGYDQEQKKIYATS
jgi:hypothetical protein